MQVSTIGVDLAKNVFQVHGVDSAGKVVITRQLRRKQVIDFFSKIPPCLVGMEACGTAHHWAREVSKLGHTVRQRGSEHGLRAGDAELNRGHLRRAKVGSRQLPGPIALRKGDGENARPLLCRTTRKRSFQLPPPSHSGPSSNDSFSRPAISSTPVTSSGTPS